MGHRYPRLTCRLPEGPFRDHRVRALRHAVTEPAHAFTAGTQAIPSPNPTPHQGDTMNHPPAPPAWTPPPPPPPRWGRFTTWTVAAAIAAFAIGGGIATLTNHDSNYANPTACKTALADNYRQAAADGPGGPTMPAPPACAGLSQTELREIVDEVVSEYLGSDQADEDMERLIREAMESAAAQP